MERHQHTSKHDKDRKRREDRDKEKWYIREGISYLRGIYYAVIIIAMILSALAIRILITGV